MRSIVVKIVAPKQAAPRWACRRFTSFTVKVAVTPTVERSRALVLLYQNKPITGELQRTVIRMAATSTPSRRSSRPGPSPSKLRHEAPRFRRRGTATKRRSREFLGRSEGCRRSVNFATARAYDRSRQIDGASQGRSSPGDSGRKLVVGPLRFLLTFPHRHVHIPVEPPRDTRAGSPAHPSLCEQGNKIGLRPNNTGFLRHRNVIGRVEDNASVPE